MSEPAERAHREVVAKAPTHGAIMAKRRLAKAHVQACAHRHAGTAKRMLKGNVPDQIPEGQTHDA